MKTFYVEVDTNDGDYVGKIVEVEDKTAKKFEPLIKKIKKFDDNNYGYNFPCRDCDDEDELCDLYNLSEEELEEFRDTFRLYVAEYGFHTITKIQEVTLGKVWLG